jgi:hypothetical protein
LAARPGGTLQLVGSKGSTSGTVDASKLEASPVRLAIGAERRIDFARP